MVWQAEVGMKGTGWKSVETGKGQTSRETDGQAEGRSVGSAAKPGSWTGRLKSLFNLSPRGGTPALLRATKP